MSSDSEEERAEKAERRRARRSASKKESSSSKSSSSSQSQSSRRLRTFSSDKLKKQGDGDGASDEENASRRNSRRSSSDTKGDGDASENTGKDSSSLKSMRDRIRTKERRVAENEPEMHVIGDIDGAVGFGAGVCCRWQLDHGGMWEHLSGHLEGQTQVDYPTDGDSAVWSHPLDAHFLCKGIQGWPRLLLQVWQMDEFGRQHLRGYGFTHVPNNPGSYEVEVATWRPVGTLKEEIATQFLGTTPQLRDIDLLFSKAWSDRCRLSTTSAGTVKVNLDVILRNFHDHAIDL